MHPKLKKKITKCEVQCPKAEFYLFIERFFKILRNLSLRGSLSLSLRSISKLSGTPDFFRNSDENDAFRSLTILNLQVFCVSFQEGPRY